MVPVYQYSSLQFLKWGLKEMVHPINQGCTRIEHIIHSDPIESNFACCQGKSMRAITRIASWIAEAPLIHPSRKNKVAGLQDLCLQLCDQLQVWVIERLLGLKSHLRSMNCIAVVLIAWVFGSSVCRCDDDLLWPSVLRMTLCH